jgi:hypothetical protein
VGRFPKNLRWGIIGPVALIAAALVVIVSLDIRHGGEADPGELLGAIGTPIRGTFVAPTATPPGAGATPRPRPTFAGVLQGTAQDRDAKRRGDLLILLEAAKAWKEREGAYISTDGNLQTLCGYRDIDKGCGYKEILGKDVPEDPMGSPAQNGYWYQSDGQSLVLYAALEQEITEAERCRTENVDLKEKSSLVCLRFP